MAVGEIFLTEFVQVLIQKLTSRELLNFVRRESVHEKLKKWSTTFSMIKAMLSDAEEKQLTSEVVKHWLDDIKNLAYDVEDVLDKFFAELLRCKIENLHRDSTSKVWGLIPTCCTISSPAAFGLFMLKMNSEIKEITGRLEDITERKNKLGLNDIGRFEIEWKRPPSSSLPDGQVIGRDEDKKKIVQLLLTDQQSNLNFDVVGIVGMAGVGKTTHAGLVFHDDAMKYFDIKVWIWVILQYVSDDFDSMRLTKAILKSINSSESENNDDFSNLQERLSKALADKKFLIVLDDVWNSKNDLHDLWVKVRCLFRFGAPGNKIVVTTREVNVAKLMGAIQHHNLECVSDDDCWQVFVQHAFFIRNTSELPNLGSVRDKILAKCNGLPLAARSFGGLFLCKEINEWEDILKNKLWTLSDHNNILPMLRLKYYHLPTHLKRCFSYCAILPEDYEFEEKQLILLWMAEGLIHQPEGTRHMEDLGKEYFRELLSRSFFHKSRKNESKYVMHDLMNDLAQWVAGETCFRLEDKQDGDNQCRIFEKARHSSYITAGCDGIQRLEAFSKVKHLRTFLPLGQSYYERKHIASYFTLQILPKLQYLRVLSLNGYHITELPDSVGELKLLRYLDLSYTHLRSLPESIGSLYNFADIVVRMLHKST
ncbi:putative disease resistance RPP13-like protein 1 [Ziziphus jujuba]|uniref:Disease resistance RPP13-like protein 1 n=1 Tax=Ziziphus jujuba TaxID=326968 RepID=A0ABM4A330_ZIZJJ|nr:putative disease resistance RPP13-like protein 1 [Ziziphus jujuba]